MKIVFRNDRGMAFPMVLLTMVVLLVLGAALISVSMSEARITGFQHNQVQAQLIARAGADIAAQRIISNPGDKITSIGATPFDSGTFAASISWLPNVANPTTVIITSQGSVQKNNERVTLTLTQRIYSELFTGILQTGGTLNTNNIVIHTSDPMYLESPSLPNLSPAQESNPLINKRINNDPLPEPDIPPDVDFLSPKGVTYTTFNYSAHVPITQNTHFNAIVGTQNAGQPLVFETGGNDLVVKARAMDLKSDLSITGGGDVHLFLYDPNGQSTFQTPSVTSGYGVSRLFLYLVAGHEMEIIGNAGKNTAFEAYVYAPSAKIYMNSNYSHLQGAVIGQVLQRGGSNTNPAQGHFTYKPLNETETESFIHTWRKSHYGR